MPLNQPHKLAPRIIKSTPVANQAAHHVVTPLRVAKAGKVALKTVWAVKHPLWTGAIALMVFTGVAVATLLIRQDITTNPAAKAPDVIFQSGTDYATINAAGYATLTVGSSGTSATLALSGVPGAALVSLGNVLKINNQASSTAYTLTLARSATPNAAINDFTVTVKSGATTIATWNAVSAAQSSGISLPAATVYDISIQVGVVDGTAAGSLGSFTIQASLVPV